MKEKNIRLIAIASGIFLGQGSMLAVQTYLVGQGLSNIVGSIGVVLGVISFCQWCSDAGGIFFLQRFFDGKNINFSELCNFIIVRLFYSLVVFCICFIIFNFINNEYYILIAACVSFVSIFNIGSMFDAGSRVLFFAPLNAVPWLLCSVCMYFELYSPESIGEVYLFGVVVVIVFQWAFVSKFQKIEIFGINKYKITTMLKESVGIVGSGIVGQLYARMFPIIIDGAISSSAAGMYLAAKSYANASNQIISIIMRSSYVELVAYKGKVGFFSIVLLQKSAQIFAFIAFIFSLLVVFLVSGEYKVLAGYSAFLQLAVFIWVFSYSVGQFFISRGDAIYYFLVNFLSVFVGVLVFFATNKIFNNYSPFLSEICISISQFLLFYFFMRIKYGS